MILTARWWVEALKRAGRTAIVLIVPYVVGVPLNEVDPINILLIATLGFVSSLLTSLKGLPEIDGKVLPWWRATLNRMAKSFGQGVFTGLGSALLLTDVDWSAALLLGLGGALGSLLLAALSALPETQEPTEGGEQMVVYETDAQVSAGYTPDVTAGYLDVRVSDEDDSY